MGWGQGSGKMVPVGAEHSRCWLLLQLLLFQLSMEVPPGPLEVGMEVTGLGCSGGWGLGRAVQAKDWQKAWPPVLLALGSQWAGESSVLPGERPWPLGGTVAR